ncbi:MAG: glycoside hydrolase family 13 protein, partial [Clostridia bacterium]|nr:glycoside hydrolase family 13 protein [Clostridia bacterium]
MSLFGAFPDDGEITFRLVFDEAPRSASLVIHSDGLADEDGEKYRTYKLTSCDGVTFEVGITSKELSSLSSNGLLYYRYDVEGAHGVYSLGGEEVVELLPRSVHGDRQLLIYNKNYTTPSSFKGGTMYHIFVDRFASSGKYPLKSGAKLNGDWENGIPEFASRRGAPIKNNEFFGGDLTGILERLDYIESLGVTVLYLSPIFDSPSNHKYDTSDYMRVDPMFGGDGALSELLAECERRGIKVILDGVFNHTGDDSVYFDRYNKYGDAGAYNNPESKYYEWYNFRHYPDDYECWWNIVILPRVDSSGESFRKFILGDGGVVDKYIKMGVCGFRLDVADELSDVFLEDMRRRLKGTTRDMLLIGEVWEDASNKIAYSERRRYLGGRELDSVMNYPLREGAIAFIKYGDHALLKRVVETIYRHYPKCASDVLMNFLGTHDTERIITVLAGEPDDGKTPAELSVMRLSDEQMQAGRKLVKCAWSIVATTYGIPSIFYGDEAGLEGYHDPFCRRPFPWGKEDAELEDFFSRFGRFRKSETLFKEGYYRVVCSDENVFVT